MRSFRSSAIILTLFMLLLVAGAAFAFLLQGGLVLRESVLEAQATADWINQQKAQTELLLGASEATREASFSALATAENNVLLLDGQLVASEQEKETRVAGLETQLATAEADLATSEAGAQNQLPMVGFIEPRNRTLLSPGQPLRISIVASDTGGLDSVRVLTDGRVHISYTDLNAQTLITRTTSWTTPNEAGEHTIAVAAMDVDGGTSEAMITVIVSAVGTPTTTATPTTPMPTTTLMPTATP